MAQETLIQCQALFEKVARELADQIVSNLGDEIDAIILYGSVARGEATEQSDIDLLVIGRNIHSYERAISDISYDLDLEYGTLTTIIYRSPEEIHEYVEMGSTFLPKVFQTGVILYEQEGSLFKSSIV